MKLSMQVQAHNSMITFEQAFKEFLFIKSNRNVSEETIKDYNNIIGIFIKFYGKENLCSNITSDTIEEYTDYLKNKYKKKNKSNGKESLTSVTIATYIRHLRSVLYFFMDKGYIQRFKIKLPISEKEVKEVYTDEELKLLLKKPDLKKCTFSEYRNWVMTNYFLSTANRLRTVVNLNIEDLNFSDDEICLRKVKNHKQYTIPMQRELKKILIEYLKYRGGEPKDPLFCSENDDKKRLASSSVKSAISKYNLRRGVIKTGIHIYRNTFAKYWILQGGDMIRLQAILGHKDISMVREYVDMYGKDLKRNFDEYNPLSAYSKGEHVSLKR